MKRIIRIISFVFVLSLIAAIPVSASSAYQTYTYSIDGKPLYSPDAYTANGSYDSLYMELEKSITDAKDESQRNYASLNDPNDLEVDDEGNLYIADSGNNRILILDRYYKYKFMISKFVNQDGISDSLNEPQGVFVTKDTIWVCDTENERIVLFDRQGNFKKILTEPESTLFDTDAIYKPVAIAVDEYNRLYVVSSTTYQGIIVMTDEGEFTGFIGAQAVTVSAWDILWRKFMTDEQIAQTEKNVSKEFNNISITKDGFIYATITFKEKDEIASAESAIVSKDKSGKYAPVKLLNTSGAEIMRRNGFWPPAGEIDYASGSTDQITGISDIVDVAVGEEKTWTIVDSKRSKIYTYDFDGNLLFAFGDSANTSDVLGCIKYTNAVVYSGSDMLILDSGNKCIVCFKRTEYGDLLLKAIACENAYDFDGAIEYWKQVITLNQNFDAAYVGIGKALYRSGKFSASLEYFKKAFDTSNYSTSFKEVRREWMSQPLHLLLFIVIIVGFIFGLVKFFGWIGRVNKAATLKKTKRTFGEELAYGFYVMVHPFDGFWDLKHEKRGSVRASFVFIGVAILSFFYQSIGQGYVSNPRGNYSSIIVQIISVIVPLFLFVISNWCLTTLFEGEGSFKDIFVAVSYSLVPIPLLIIPSTILSNFLTSSEVGIATFIASLAFVWAGALIFFGTQVTHDYSTSKNLLMIIATVVGMAFIMFLAILFSTLVGKLISLITNIVEEIQYRI